MDTGQQWADHLIFPLNYFYMQWVILIRASQALTVVCGVLAAAMVIYALYLAITNRR